MFITFIVKQTKRKIMQLREYTISRNIYSIQGRNWEISNAHREPKGQWGKWCGH